MLNIDTKVETIKISEKNMEKWKIILSFKTTGKEFYFILLSVIIN